MFARCRERALRLLPRRRNACVRSSVAAIVALFTLGGCSTYSKSDGERLQAEVYDLQTKLKALQASLRSSQSAQREVKERLDRVHTDVSALNTAARRNDADIGVVLDVVRQDVARMKGQMDSVVDRVSVVESEAAQTKEEVDLRFQNMAEQERIRAEENARAKAQAMEAAKKRESLLRSPKRTLAEADRLLKDNPARARQLLRALELKRGKSRGWSTYAPQTSFLIGETYFLEKNYQKAAASFNTVRKKYPKSSRWVPQSILRLGMCFEKLGLKDDAKLFYQSVSRKYPKHPAGREGKKLLSKLGI